MTTMEFNKDDEKMLLKYMVILKQYCDNHECKNCVLYVDGECDLGNRISPLHSEDSDTPDDKFFKKIINIFEDYCCGRDCHDCIFDNTINNKLTGEYEGGCVLGVDPKEWNLDELLGDD